MCIFNVTCSYMSALNYVLYIKVHLEDKRGREVKKIERDRENLCMEIYKIEMTKIIKLDIINN